MYSKLAKVSAVVLMALPFVSSAQPSLNPITTIPSAFSFVFILLNSYIIPLIIALAGLYFMWGLLQYVAGGDKGKDDAKGVILWGIIILVVMLTFWGIVNLFQNSLFGQVAPTLTADDIPNFQTTN